MGLEDYGFNISPELKQECGFGQKGEVCRVLSRGKRDFAGLFHPPDLYEVYFIREIPFKEYKDLEKISKFSGKDYVSSIIDIDTTLIMIDKIERLEKGLDTAMSSLGSCVVRRE